MNALLTLVLAFFLLLNLFGLTAALRAYNLTRRKLKYVEGALERARTLAMQKDVTVKRQQDEINLLNERYRTLEEQLHLARLEAAAYHPHQSPAPEKVKRIQPLERPDNEQVEERVQGLRAV
jgi:hypothetical protein